MGVEIHRMFLNSTFHPSCPARGMGVEIGNGIAVTDEEAESCPARGMGVEMSGVSRIVSGKYSHAPRGAWE